jgi:hypothetical protein
MTDAEKYRGFEQDCLRMAAKASEADKKALMEMAKAWKMRAEAAEMQKKKKKD